VTGGAQVALHALCSLLLDRGDLIAAGATTYPGLKAVAMRMGLVLAPLDMDDQGIIPDAFEKVCRERSPRVLYLVPSVDNPTTATLPEDRRRGIAALARTHGTPSGSGFRIIGARLISRSTPTAQAWRSSQARRSRSPLPACGEG